MDEQPRRPQLGAADYNAAAFTHNVFGGGLRWFATVCAAGSAILLVWRLVDPNPPDIAYPIQLGDRAAMVAIILLLAFWSLVAAVNWRARVIGRRGSPDA